MKRIIKSVGCLVVVAMAMVLILNFPVYAEKKAVKFGYMAWPDFQVSARVTKNILENKFGYKVELVEFVEWGVAFAAASKGDVDFFDTGINFYAHDYWARFKEKLEKIGAKNFGLFMGLIVPSYVPINSIDELNVNKDKFKGKIIGVEKGSGINRMTREVIEAYKLDYNFVESSTPGMAAEVQSALNKKEWIIATLWTPSWMTLKWDVKFLADPKGIQEPQQGGYWIGRKGFAKDLPFLRELLSGFFFKYQDRLIWLGWLKEGKSYDEIVATWMELPSSKKLIERWCVIGSPDRYK